MSASEAEGRGFESRLAYQSFDFTPFLCFECSIGKSKMKSVIHTKTFQVDVPIDTLFPLFSPEGEKYWVPGWDYKNIMGTTVLAEDYVFVTENHDHGASEAIWIVKAYDPDTYRVQFYKVEPGHKVGIITVECFAESGTLTTVKVSYKYTALSTAGEEFILGFGEVEYEKFIDEWKELLVRYFKQKNSGRA